MTNDIAEAVALEGIRIDRKLERQFRDTRPAKELCCVVPGCSKKFRPSTDYAAFLVHWEMKHKGVKP